MQLTVTKEKDGLMLSRLLLQAADVPQWAVKEAMKNRDVRINGERITGDVRVEEGQEIRVYWSKKALAAQKKRPSGDLEIVFEDEHVLLVNKPQGLASQNEENPLSGDSALTRAIRMQEDAGKKTDQFHLCHRLDVQTGGLLLFVKDDAAYESAVEAFAKRTMSKFYTCLVKGCPTRREAIMHAYLRKDAQLARVSVTDDPVHGSAEIITGYRVLEGGPTARLEVELITGRTHQIRAHLAHVGHPILGDDKYGDRALNRELGVRRQQLWATRLIVQADGALSYLNGREFTAKCPF